jgi:hypothetical protein
MPPSNATYSNRNRAVKNHKKWHGSELSCSSARR